MTTHELGALRRDGERLAVRFERIYEATLEEVWRALTEPDELAGWLAPARQVELRPGGKVQLDFGDDDQMHGVVQEVEPPRVLEYRWDFPGEWESVVRFELRPHERGVLLVLDHRALPPETAAAYGAGWHAHLDMLEARLAGGQAEFMPRYRELRPSYDEQGAALP